ncbi:hypothetical protein EGW08_020913 [Elysia chlorotica]|uniref:DEP domain-containing protein n=1 Tax=Elysia chlorotica TaxID=188477 RepID=A0A3S0Z5U1_ELYCH|nr:hypothetical protein EGW08_020913 [Elysia chlorotica]
MASLTRRRRRRRQDQEPPPKLFNKLKTRLRLHLQNLGILCNILTVYSTNILCMDLCGTPKAVAKKLIGSNLVNFVRKQQEDGVVWGCRHQGEVPYSCLYYFNRRVDYLCERYEPVTQHMCTRVNNAFACLYLLDEYCDRLAHVFGLEDDGQGIEEAEEEEEEEEEEDQQWEKEKTGTGAAETDIQGREEQLQASERSEGGASGVTSSGDNSLFDVISTSSGYLTSEATAGLEQRDTPQGRYPSGSKYEEPYVNSEDDSLSETMCSVPSVSLKQRWRTQVQQTCSAARHHLLATVTSMCRLQAYKLNLFVRDGLPMLLRLKDPAVTMDSCLSPIITFMHRYLDSLSGWLYRDCFRRVLDYLWVLIVQDIEYHANRLLSAESSASGQAHDWMLAIGVLIRFMNNSGRGIKKELLLSQANNVIFCFQLFTLSTNRLITLHQKLKEYHTEVDELTLEENATRIPPAIIHRIHGDLQSLRKCFSGGELVRWIVKNRSVLPADLSVADEEITKDIAIEIAQDLLDNNFIMELESAFQTKSTTPTSPLDQFSPYPELLVHSHLPSEAEDSSWEEAEGRQHHHSQYYHPKEDVRSGSRSGNNMEAAAVFKEQQAEVHHTFPPLSARSSPGSITPTGSMGNPSAGKGEKSSRKETGTPPSFRGPEGLSSLGLGSRYNPSPLRPTPVYSNRDQLNPGPIHHDTASGKRSADLREPLNQRYRTFVEISHEEEDRVSSDRTPTPSRQRFGEGSSVSQRAQAHPECTDQKGLSTPEVASARPGSVNQYHLRETEFLGSLSSRASVADFRSSAVKPQSKSQAGGYGRLRKDSDALSVDSAGLFGRLDFDNVVSPFSSIAELAYTANKQFVASSKHFYFIHQSVLNPSLSFFRHRQQRGEHGSRGTAHHRHGRRAQQSRHQEQHRQKDQHSLYQQMENHSQLFESRRVRSEPSRHLSAPSGSAATFGPDAMSHLGANFGTQQQDHREGRKDEDAEVTWHQKNAMENLALVEQCISHKISTEYIAAIITGRKKTDKLAKEFFRLSFTG